MSDWHCRTRRLEASRTLGIALTALILVVSGCSQGIDIYDARVSVDGTVVLLIVGACHANETVEVDEQTDKVVVLVRGREDGAVDQDCADAVYFQLSAPLGARILIDASDGDEVEVRVSESVTSLP